MISGPFLMTDASDGTFVERCRALGAARVSALERIRSQEDWQRLWQAPAQEFPFAWGPCWRATVELRVADFAAELGFYLDLLGFVSHAAGADFAMLATPDHAFGFSLAPAGRSAPTPPESISIQFRVAELPRTVEELRRRGVPIAQEPLPNGSGSRLHTAAFLTPNGHRIQLWGLVGE
jgi:predicted enzyme related to lactoylglutathione lyase